MRILHVLGKLDIGGAENLMMNVYRRIIHQGIQFDFVVHSNDGLYFDEIQNLGGRIYCCPAYCGINHFEYKKWWKNFFVDHSEYQIVHTHIRSTASIILKIARDRGLRTLAHAHSTSNGGGVKGIIKNILQKGVVKYTDIALVCSEDAGVWQFGKNYRKRCQVITVKNGIDVELYHRSEEQKRQSKELLLLQDYFVVGHVGRIVKAKNHEFLLQVFLEIKKRKDNAKLLLVGSGELECNIKAITEELGLSDSVIFCGERKDVPELLKAMDVFVFPSLWEGFGLSALESQAVGLPTFVSDRVPESICVTSLAHRIPLSSTAGEWAETILSYSSSIDDTASEQIVSLGYDINSTVRTLSEIYLN